MAEKIYIIDKKHGLLDACIQVYGASSFLFRLAKDNNLLFDAVVNIGDELIYDDTLGDAELKNKISGENKIINNPVTSLYLSETISLINRMVVKPSINRSNLIDETIRLLLEFSLWDKFDILYFEAAHDSQAANLNWKKDVFNLVPVNSPLFTIDEGYTGDGATMYLDTEWIVSLHAEKFSLNSACIGCYIRTDVNEVSVDLGVRASQHSFIRARVSNFFDAQINFGEGGTGAVLSVANLDSRGMYIASRISDLDFSIYKNKIKTTGVRQSFGIPVDSLYILAYNSIDVAIVHSSRQQSISFAGGGLTQADVENLNDIFGFYMDSIGKGVV